MKKNGYQDKRIKALAWLMAASILYSGSMTGMAAEESSQTVETQQPAADPQTADAMQSADQQTAEPQPAADTASVQYITDIQALPQEETYFAYGEKMPLETLQSIFPKTLTVFLEGGAEPVQIDVTWECGTDYAAPWTGEGKESYVFLPKWDPNIYMFKETPDKTISIPQITVEIVKEEIPKQIESLETAQGDLQGITDQKSILAVVYLCNTYDIKDAPGIDAATVVSVTCGQSVQIVGVDLDGAGNAWYKVLFYQQDQQYEGYIEERFLATSDEKFLDWTDEYVEEAPVKQIRPMMFMAISSYPDINQFPPSYQNMLTELKRKYPNWKFVKMETGLDFNTAVANEIGNKNWIQNSKPASWKNGAAAQSGWSYASEAAVRYYMDPRNFLNESNIFEFEQLTYNASYHTENAVQAILAKSFMAGEIPNENMTYARAFTAIGEELKVSPFHLASRVLQEQGAGKSALISGTYSGYEGYYNYFNVGAYGRDVELIVRGLKEAVKRQWDTRYKSLRGGGEVVANDYILRGQDTLYLQKFNVTSNSTYNHQYMQNIMAPESESTSIKRAYADSGVIDHCFVFNIPVYSGMPASACPKPDSRDVITLNQTVVDNLAVDKTTKLVPYVNDSKVDNLSGMIFTSSSPETASVDNTGVVKALTPGTATITCARDGAVSAACTVTVVKAEASVDTPVLSPVVYRPGLTLADIALPSGWSWADGSTLLNSGTFSYPAVYTPADTVRYLPVTRQVGIMISKAIASCTVPEKLTAKIGDKLGSIALPAGFVWESDGETILDKAGEQTFYLSYYPGENYFAQIHLPVVVKVLDEQTKEPDGQDDPLPGTSGTSGGSTGGSGGTSGGSTGGNGGTPGSSPAGSSTPGSSPAGNSTPGSSTGGSGGTSGSSTSGESGSSGGSTAGESGTPGNSGSSGSSTPGESSTPGNSTAGNSTPGSSPAGSGTPGSSTAGSGTPGNSMPGSSPAGNSTPGSSSAGESSTSGSSGSAVPEGSGTLQTGSTDTPETKNPAADSSSTQPVSNAGQPSEGGSSPASNDNGSNTSAAGGNADSSTSGGNTSAAGAPQSNTEAGGASVDPINAVGAGGVSNGNTGAGGSTDGNAAAGVTARADSDGSDASAAAGESGADLLSAGNTSAKGSDDAPKTDDAQDEEEASMPYTRPAVLMDMEDISILTREVLQAGKDQNVDMILTMNDRAKWYVDAGSVQSDAEDTDMGVSFGGGVVPKDILEQTAGDRKYLEFDLAHDGPFGFAAELEIALDPEDSGRYANLFYYDTGDETLEFLCAVVIDENGYARFPMDHASHYVIIVSDEPMSAASVGTAADNGETGFPQRYIVICAVAAAVFAALAAGGYFWWKKRQEEDDGEGDSEDDNEEGSSGEDNKDDSENDNEEDSGNPAVHPAQTAGAEDQEQPEDESEVMRTDNDEDDWIEDADWQEPENEEKTDPYADDHAENDWIEDDEWDISNDWMDDAEWEKKIGAERSDAER